MRLIFIFTSFLFFSCENENDSNLYQVTGGVQFQGEPAEGATVNIDNKLNYTTTTDVDGRFIIKDVSEGAHEITMSYMHESSGDKGFTERTYQINVVSDTDLESQTLPEPIKIFTLETGAQFLNIGWNVSDENDFREYKLYRHNNTGIDENSAELVHVSTSVNDTTFFDEALTPSTNYFYRVYVLNNFGRLGGSDILQTATRMLQPIKNSGFENESNGTIDNWILDDDWFSLDNTTVYEGNNSLTIVQQGDESSYYERRLIQNIDTDLLTPGVKYRLSFAHNSDFSSSGDMFIYLKNSKIDIDQYVRVDFVSDIWSEFSYDFTLPNDVGTDDIEFQLFFLLSGGKQWWIDEVKLVKIN